MARVGRRSGSSSQNVVQQRRMLDESPAAEDFKRIQSGKLDALLTLAEAHDCRRVRLLSYFGQTRITYSPRQILAQRLVRETLTKYPRLRGINIFAASDGQPAARLIAGTNPAEIGRLAQALENDVIARSSIYYGKDNDSVLVTFPLHDVNGDTVAAIKLMMKSFPGQTEKNALARALPIVKEIESRIQRGADLLQ